MLRIDERPDFIDLDALASQIDEYAVLIPSGGLPSINHELAHGLFARPGQAGHGADRIALTQQMEDAGTGFTVELVHWPD